MVEVREFIIEFRFIFLIIFWKVVGEWRVILYKVCRDRRIDLLDSSKYINYVLER